MAPDAGARAASGAVSPLDLDRRYGALPLDGVDYRGRQARRERDARHAAHMRAFLEAQKALDRSHAECLKTALALRQREINDNHK